MPIRESDSVQSAPRSIPLTTGLGIIFGLFFGIPPALGAHAMGLTWLPYCAGVIFAGLTVGLSLAYLVMVFVIDEPYPGILPAPRPSPTSNGKSGRPAGSPIKQRMAEENARLERLYAEREALQDARFGTATEQRIVWSELLELELQDIDEQMSRICGAAGVATGPCPQTPSGYDTYREQRRSS